MLLALADDDAGGMPDFATSTYAAKPIRLGQKKKKKRKKKKKIHFSATASRGVLATRPPSTHASSC
jgi:hypothetical protein